jgi:sugar phosphate isomerase/epimerase
MKAAVSQVCSLESPFEKDFEDYAVGGCTAIELWVGKLDQYLAARSVADVLSLLKQHQVKAPVASFQGGLLASQGEFRREHWNSFSRRLEQLASLGVETLVLAADVPAPFDEQALARVQVSLKQAATEAPKHGVRLALEFQAHSVFINNLQTAAALVAEVSSPWLGICFDAFHYYVGPSKFEDLVYLSSENLFHVQFCDLAGNARELVTDADRVLPGDGDFELAAIAAHLRQIGYAGYVSVEVMNPQIWRIPARQVGEISLSALTRILDSQAA